MKSEDTAPPAGGCGRGTDGSREADYFVFMLERDGVLLMCREAQGSAMADGSLQLRAGHAE
ncbi:hypothetical protein FLT15_05630 [Paenibacillus thiaminolyticus]|uniref:hypothetical protein n=1 Tax=Paenibacillus thiaminolyticus TaxID=49283 RepID=UPI00116501D0|nr:hypothetical protein [Paenibacillus thiaminolyticus]NGP57893.1 hypothetical protein [Paenibacillus thiaminolyticus]